MTSAEGRDPRPPESILHVDLDAFYASVEILKEPTLAGRPVVVGYPGPRGVVLAASYEARARGLESGMPGVRARRLCPEAVFIAPDFASYRWYSGRFRDVLLAFTPLVEPLSLDEAFLDVSGATLLFGTPPEVAARIRSELRARLSLAASVGVAPTKLVAKLASARAKPDGVLVVPASSTLSFLHALPVSALWGVGEKTAGVLARLGLRTVGELAATPSMILERAVGEAQARALLDLAHGRDERSVVPYEPPKSVGHEQTYPRDLDDEEEILREILALSHRVAARLREEGYRARTVTLKLRLPSFATLTRSRTLATATDVGAEIYRVGRQLFAGVGRPRRFRLIGVAGHGLVRAGIEQLAFEKTENWEGAERALDLVRRRFGADAAAPAALLESSQEDRASP